MLSEVHFNKFKNQKNFELLNHNFSYFQNKKQRILKQSFRKK